MEPTDTIQQAPGALSLIEGVRDRGVLAVDARGRICAFNQEAERLANLRSGAVLAQSYKVLPEPLRELIRETTSARANMERRQLTLPSPDGAGVPVHASTTCSLTESGECAGVLVVMTDFAANAALVANLQRLDRLASVGMLSASMAHEIKNALVAVSTFVQDLIERNKDAELAGLVQRELRRMDSLVGQMLKFAGPPKPEFSRVSVRGILDHCLRLIQPELKTKQIRLQRSFDCHPDTVDGDDYQLEQAFLNLLMNAVSAMDRDGQLTVSIEATGTTSIAPQTEASDRGVRINIADTGIGIAPEHLERLFEPFYSTKAESTGLGLAITHRIVKEHRGMIRVESAPQKGTTFQITLPLARLNG